MTEPRRRAPATKLLILAIAIGLIVQFVTGAMTDPIRLALLGAIVDELILEHGQWWRLISAMFLHGNGTISGTALHATMNLWALFQLGTIYELMFGTRRFVTVYFVSGIVASLTSLFLTEGWSVGASGAIFGIMGAFIFSVLRSPRWQHNKGARSIANQVVFWSLANILIGSQIPQIDIAAHVGGFIAGLILGAVLPHRVPPPPPAEVVVDVRPN
ncbi:MAG TPA: rhomboid family intramembrane serine protease [Thermoanaerobaculia bacterium]|nr:rhomboid family intramembrane serine protease [Thermoanaerobaculia bacterium]